MSVKDEPNLGEGTIKIAIPMQGETFSEHFGGAEEFLVFEANRNEVAAGKGVAHPAPEHKPGSLPTWLAALQVDAVVVSAIGQRAVLMLADAGIETYFSCGKSDPSALAAACLQGKLPRANRENSRCNGTHDHEGHGCSHH